LERSVRVLVVDDYAPFRHFIYSTLHKQRKLHVIGEASDGLDAIQKAQELHPDLILLDIGLPRLSGLEAARQIRQLVPKSKILILSDNRSWNIAEEALRLGAGGYVVKSDAATELMLAVESVLEGRRYVSISLGGYDLDQPIVSISKHEAGFYSDDSWLLEDVTRFLGTALKAGNAAIVIATESHRNVFLRSLRAFGLDPSAAIQQGRYIALDAAEVLSTFMSNGIPDPIRFMKAFGDLIAKATRTAHGQHPRVAVFGECVQLLCAQGKPEAAIQMEKLGNRLIKEYDLDILCGYSVTSLSGLMDEQIYQRIRAEHSAIHSH
jgi:CheY-like chemotaxis protein